MTIKNLINHLKYFNCKFKQINESTIIYKSNTSPQYEVLPSTKEYQLSNIGLYVEVFDYNKQSDELLNYNPTIKESLDYIISRAPGCDPITGK